MCVSVGSTGIPCDACCWQLVSRCVQKLPKIHRAFCEAAESALLHGVGTLSPRTPPGAKCLLRRHARAECASGSEVMQRAMPPGATVVAVREALTAAGHAYLCRLPRLADARDNDVVDLEVGAVTACRRAALTSHRVQSWTASVMAARTAQSAAGGSLDHIVRNVDLRMFAQACCCTNTFAVVGVEWSARRRGRKCRNDCRAKADGSESALG